MANLMKHVGKFGEKPCVVVFREVPNEPENCLIVETSLLENQKHDDLMNVIQSLEAQESNNIADVLSRRQFTDGSNILNDLHFSKKLQKVAVDMVFLTPTPSDKISLKEVNSEINKLEGGYTPPKTDPVSVDTQPITESADAELPEASVAENLLVQAELLEQDAKAILEDAEAKKSEAYNLDPSLKPKKSSTKKKS
ncbi:hypothetical protein N9N08_00390 [bacterium]|jgi:hypothetical protein|nr:hypothetical protein [bacterium]